MSPRTLDEYARWTKTTALDPRTKLHSSVISELFITVTGLSGELGEVMEHLKKRIRDGKVIDSVALKKEMGDLLFYWARLCNQLGLTPSDVVATNVEKIQGRIERGTQRGSGDHR